MNITHWLGEIESKAVKGTAKDRDGECRKRRTERQRQRRGYRP